MLSSLVSSNKRTNASKVITKATHLIVSIDLKSKSMEKVKLKISELRLKSNVTEVVSKDYLQNKGGDLTPLITPEGHCEFNTCPSFIASDGHINHCLP